MTHQVTKPMVAYVAAILCGPDSAIESGLRQCSLYGTVAAQNTQHHLEVDYPSGVWDQGIAPFLPTQATVDVRDQGAVRSASGYSNTPLPQG
jgi:hypothetical protein